MKNYATQKKHRYSPEAASILGKAPSWVVRWGVTVVFDIFAGKIVEQGTHAELTAARGYYYELVKNQLELGN